MSGNLSFIAISKNIYFLGIAGLTPLVRPWLPFNTIFFDYINGFFMCLFITWLFFVRNKIEIRLVVPYLVILCGSLLAIINSQAVVSNFVTLVQEIYLVTFFLVLYNIIDDKRDIRTLVLLWIIFSALEANLILAEFVGDYTIRAQGTFEGPNMAGTYLGISFFLVFQPYFKMGMLFKLVFVLLITGGIFATKSMGTALGLVIGSLVTFTLYWVRVGVMKKAKLAFAVLVFWSISILIVPQLMEVPNFVDRSQGSSEGRYFIWKAGFESFINNPLGIAIGPGGFVETATDVGDEIHSDYLSFLVERGIIGFIGLFVLLGTVVSMLMHCIKNTRSEQEFLWAVGLCAMFLFILINALTHEVMHFRHVWFAFALIAAEEKLIKRELIADCLPDYTNKTYPLTKVAKYE
jgi:O-antigen ligase